MSFTNNHSKTRWKADIIVVGAGISGISCARKLLETGQDVIVLEARAERIGGRIAKSGVFHDIPVDLGASWLHTIKENPLLDYALKNRVEMSLTKNPYLIGAENFVLYDSKGKPVSVEEQNATRQKYDQIFNGIADYLKNLPPEKDISAAAAFDLVEQRFCGLPHNKEIYDWLKSSIEGFENAKLQSLSAKSHFDQEKVFFEGEGFLKGFFRVLELLAEPVVRAGRVHLDQRVVCIDQSSTFKTAPSGASDPDSNWIKVHTSSRTYFCQRVIVTVPLGVLKKKAIEFRPPLPADKQSAIDALGFGVANKLYMEFDHCFWDPTSYGFGYMSGTSDRQFHIFINLMPLYGKPILFCPTVCATAEWIEKSSDEEVTSEVLSILSKIFGPHATSRQCLHRFTITRWASDEFALGAYSFFNVGCTPNDVTKLAAPFGKVYFAGEATYNDDIGYAHGAFLTGWREADRILNEIRSKRTNSSKPLYAPTNSQQLINSFVTASKL